MSAQQVPARPPGEPGPPPSLAFNLLAKPTGARCNLDCAYCFFISKEMLYPGSRFRMSDEVLHAYLRQLIEAQPDAPQVTISWQGGEPTLMGIDFFRRSVEIAAMHLKPGQRAVHTIQTNGTLIDAEWAAFLAENDYLVGISIDGPEPIHDTYRRTRGGRGSFQRVMRGLSHLRAANVSFNTLTTVHAANAEHGREVYRFLRDECGSRFIQLIPIVERVAGGDGGAAGSDAGLEDSDAGVESSAAGVQGSDAGLAGSGAGLEDMPAERALPWSSWRDRPLYLQRGSAVTARSVTGEQYGRFLIDIFEDWVRSDVGSVFVQMFDVALANWAGAPPGLCVHSERCGLGLALEHNGDLYSCDHFVEPDHLLGNITETPIGTLIASPAQRRFGAAKRDALPRRCLECDVRFACHGGCPRNRFLHTSEEEPGLNHLCDGYRAFFGHVRRPMEIMSEMLRSRRAPAQIMRLYASEDSRRSRNDPCSCGSGRKWKRCHGSAGVVAPSADRR